MGPGRDGVRGGGTYENDDSMSAGPLSTRPSLRQNISVLFPSRFTSVFPVSGSRRRVRDSQGRHRFPRNESLFYGRSGVGPFVKFDMVEDVGCGGGFSGIQEERS